MSAAVADYKPKAINKGKIKKEDSENLTIETVKNHGYIGVSRKK